MGERAAGSRQLPPDAGQAPGNPGHQAIHLQGPRDEARPGGRQLWLLRQVGLVSRGVPSQLPAIPQGPTPGGKGAELPVPAPIAGATPAEGIRLARVAEPMALRRRHGGWLGTVGTPGALGMATMVMMVMMMPRSESVSEGGETGIGRAMSGVGCDEQGSHNGHCPGYAHD